MGNIQWFSWWNVTKYLTFDCWLTIYGFFTFTISLQKSFSGSKMALCESSPFGWRPNDFFGVNNSNIWRCSNKSHHVLHIQLQWTPKETIYIYIYKYMYREFPYLTEVGKRDWYITHSIKAKPNIKNKHAKHVGVEN